MGHAKELMIEMEEKYDRRLADILGITFEELGSLHYEIDEDLSSDGGIIYNYIIQFNDENNEEILQKIKGLEGRHYVYIPAWELNNGDNEEMRSELAWEVENKEQAEIFYEQVRIVTEWSSHADDLDTGKKFSLLVMLYSYTMASIEQYLSSFFIHKVTNDDGLMRKLIETDTELGRRKFELRTIYAQHENIKVTVADYLKSLIFHKLEKIEPLYKNVLEYDFGDISWLFKAIRKRHDCVHRCGYDKDGNKIEITPHNIEELTNNSMKLVDDIEAHFVKFR